MLASLVWGLAVFVVGFISIMYFLAIDYYKYAVKKIVEALQQQNAKVFRIRNLLSDDSTPLSFLVYFLLASKRYEETTLYFVEYWDADGKLQSKVALLSADLSHIEWKDRQSKSR